jgi:hypothetical protein
MLLLWTLACGVDPAPDDLDGLVHWLWDHHGDPDDVDWDAGFANMLTALDPLDDTVTGDLSDLTAEQTTGFSDGDPTICRGLLMARRYSCTLAKLEPILYALDQDAQYTDVYTGYDRAYTSDLADFTSRISSKLTWEVTASAQLLGVGYTEDLLGGLHFVTADDGGGALMARTWMPAAATWDTEGWTWTQDYQIELWLEPEPGTLWHVYGLWRDMDLGGLTMDNDGVAGTTLDSMADWDSATEELCSFSQQ